MLAIVSHDEPGGAGPYPAPLQSLRRRRFQRRMTGEPEIVVRRKIDQRPPVDDDIDALAPGDDAATAPQSGCVEPRELGPRMVFERHRAELYRNSPRPRPDR